MQLVFDFDSEPDNAITTSCVRCDRIFDINEYETLQTSYLRCPTCQEAVREACKTELTKKNA